MENFVHNDVQEIANKILFSGSYVPWYRTRVFKSLLTFKQSSTKAEGRDIAAALWWTLGNGDDNLVPRLLLCFLWSLKERPWLQLVMSPPRIYLGGKKVCRAGGVAKCFDSCYGRLCGFQNLEQPLISTCVMGLSVTLQNIAFTKGFGRRIKLKVFDG